MFAWLYFHLAGLWRVKLSVGWLLWGFQHYLRVFHSCFSPLLLVRSRRREVPAPSLTTICNLSQKIPFATPFTWMQSNTSLCSPPFPLSSEENEQNWLHSSALLFSQGKRFPCSSGGPGASLPMVPPSRGWRPPGKPKLRRQRCYRHRNHWGVFDQQRPEFFKTS